MKRKLLFAALCVVSAFHGPLRAQSWTSGAVAADDGEYYLYNIGAHRFLNRGGTWSTHAVADGQGVVCKLDDKGSSQFSIYTGVNNKFLNGDYTDGTEANWTLNPVSVSGYDNVYTLRDNLENENKYLYWVGGGTGSWGNEVLRASEITVGSENNFYWILIPKATRQNLASASPSSPLEVTYLVTNPDFEYQLRDDPGHNNVNNDEIYPWTPDWGHVTEGWTTGGFWRQNNDEATAFTNGIFFEKYSGDRLSTADKIYQNVTLAAGKYRVTCTANARGEVNYYLYAGETSTAIGSANTYSVDFVVNSTGAIEIGTKIEAGGTGDWVAFDNVRLYCLDPMLSSISSALPDGGAMTANQWYSFTVAADANYTVSAATAGDIVVVSGDALLSEAVTSTITTGSDVDLTAGTYYYKSTSNNTLTIESNNPVQINKNIIIAQKGDITSLVNGTFQDNFDGWTGGSHITWVTTRGWRGDNATKFYETGTNGALSYTLSNMPAGTYKVVAAARGYNGGKITPEIAGTSGSAYNTIGDLRDGSSAAEINTNGVEMPYSSLGGFTADDNGHNWKWITATGTLTDDGNLVINFNCVGDQWMCIDDVHLYCTELDGTSYTRTVGDGKGTINGTNDVVTADIIMENPNTILRSTNAITTAAGEYLNNNQYNSSRITKLVLYDGYDYTNSGDNFGLDYGATLYRNIPADTWCTLVVPFYPNNLDVKKVPASLSDEGVLTFEDAAASGMNDAPMLVKSTEGVTAITGSRNSTTGANKGDMTSGAGVIMNGTYSAIAAVPTGSYVVARVNEQDNLYKVNSTVSLAPFRAYFSIPADSPVKANVIALNFGDNETAIAEIENGEVKMVNGPIFNLAGQRVNKAQKGIYIVNGKKVLVK